MSAKLAQYGAISLLAIALSACSARYQTPVAVGGDDDDAVARAAVMRRARRNTWPAARTVMSSAMQPPRVPIAVSVISANTC